MVRLGLRQKKSTFRGRLYTIYLVTEVWRSSDHLQSKEYLPSSLKRAYSVSGKPHKIGCKITYILLEQQLSFSLSINHFEKLRLKVKIRYFTFITILSFCYIGCSVVLGFLGCTFLHLSNKVQNE